MNTVYTSCIAYTASPCWRWRRLSFNLQISHQLMPTREDNDLFKSFSKKP